MESSVSPDLPRRVLATAVSVALAGALLALLWHHPGLALKVILFSLLSYPVQVLGLFPGIWLRHGERVPDAVDDLERRRGVWRVLSELYLDTELGERDRVRITSILAESGYSAEQLEEILYRELHPLLHSNLLSMAGEWAGFDQTWLEKRIIERGPRRSSFAVVPGKWMVRGGWTALQARSGVGPRRPRRFGP